MYKGWGWGYRRRERRKKGREDGREEGREGGGIRWEEEGRGGLQKRGSVRISAQSTISAAVSSHWEG